MHQGSEDQEWCGCRHVGRGVLREIEDVVVDDGIGDETDELVECSRALQRHIVDRGASHRQC